MKHRIFIVVAAILLVPMGLLGQTYQTLWKQVEEAQKKDLPKTAMTHLQKIEQKAMKEKSYGQLLKSTLLHSRLQSEVAPDSLRPAVDRLEQQEKTIKEVPLKAVYDAVLSIVYQNNHQLDDYWEQKSKDFAEKALAHPEALAAVKTDGYVPFIIKEKDSEIYNHDLLSVIGTELGAWEKLHYYYSKQGNRRAACITAVDAFDSIAAIDSLLQVYGDLPEACELAIRRFQLMESENCPVAQKMTFLRNSIKRWGNWRRANWLRNMERELTRPQFTAAIHHRVAMPQESQTVLLSDLRNLESLTMRVYHTPLKGDTEWSDPDEAFKKLKSQLKEVEALRQTRYFMGHEDYEFFEDSLSLGGLESGVYLVEFSSPQTSTSRQFYFVSGVRLLSQAMPNDEMRYVAVDARTGKPLPDAIVEKKDRYGNQMFAYTPTDRYCPPLRVYGRYYYYEHDYKAEHTSLFTDRSIYRPGQTVHVTAIMWKEQSPTDNVAVGQKSVTITLRDANYKLVSEQKVTTDRYGKCSTVFTLPKGLLNGRFTILANGQSIGIRVEEYKRPTFQVEFADYQETYRAGDTVYAQGKALTYAGVPVQGAKVKYTVRRKVAFWWMSYSRYWENGFVGNSVNNEVMKEGEAVTADDGTFMVEMPMLLPRDLGHRPMFYHFVVEADVTDLAGETHSGTFSLPLGNKPTALTCDIPEQIRKDQLPSVTFNRRNAAGKEIAGTVKYRIDGGKWNECAANATVSLPSSIKSGSHRLEAVCEEDTVTTRFVVFGLNDKKPAAPTKDWFYVSHQQFPNDGKPVTLQVGSSDPDLYIFYAIYAGKKVIEKGEVRKDGELINRQFTYKEEYGNGLLLTYAWVKDGECYSHQQTIKRPMPDKQLRLSWETFRNRLVPGQQEEWRLKIQNPDDTPANASLLAVLYDKSLDQIRPHQWSFTPTNYLPMPSTAWHFRRAERLSWMGSQRHQSSLKVDNMVFSHFDSSVYPYYHTLRIRGAHPMLMAKAASGNTRNSFDVMGNDAAASEVLKAKEVIEQPQEEQASEQEHIQLRENLDETAFCYPALETDQAGNVVIKFTLPESLTTWRFMGVANTVNMLYGHIDGEAVAQKELMVQPNMPRFLREGDEAAISMRIINMGQQTMKDGTALLRLYDEESEVLSVSEPFEVEAGKTTSVSFHIPASVLKPGLLTCKVSAIATTPGFDGFSDGEQHYLPVLPDKEYVTKTVPYTQHEPGVKSIDLTRLFPAGTTQQKLTVEYTNNPAWLMVQSLPVLGQPWEHSAIDQAASYYSNLLAKTLLDKNPQVKTTFEAWKRESNQTSLTSQLEKNQELKDLVLNETPWVGAADRESEQKQRLADFFDENGINNRLTMAVGKLQKLQNADGSFSWYPGMPGSTQITVAVLEMMVRLNKMVGNHSSLQTLNPSLDKAFGYVAQEMVKVVNDLKKQAKKGVKPTFPSFTALRWLYLCALDGRALPSDVKTANNYLIALLKKDIKRQTIYEKAVTAIVLATHGERQKAREYVQSLKEYTVFTEEMGRYYDTRRASYSWYDYKIPTEVAAIEAIQQVTPQDTKTVDEMRRWLLQEKRTQAWDTPINSVNAIWAFLANNSHNSLTNPASPTTLAIDGTPIDLPKATAGLGYVKTAISSPQGKTFTATKTSEGTSWGAVYAQFFQKTAEVEASQSGITVKREIMSKENNGPWSMVNGQCKVGSRIKVRITIETTRDLDFVQVVDHRAACTEPVRQLSGYQQGAYVSPKDAATHYFYYGLAKGKHVIETEYYIDRAGCYETGTCSVGCAYAPEYRATAPSQTLNIE